MIADDAATMSPGSLIGKPMPSFELLDEAGRRVSSASLIGDGPLVLFFYPRDFTAGCTAEACGFRDSHADLAGLGARVVGISADDAATHADFKARHRLPYTLLSDRRGEVARRFGVKRVLGLVPGRETFVVDEAGIVRAQVRGLLDARRHVREALAALRRMSGAR